MTRMAFSRRQTRLTVFVATLSLVMVMSPGMGQAQTPPIMESGLNTNVGDPTTLPNGTINYDITGGTRPGGGANLFHSFDVFDVPDNNIANFLNKGSVDLAGNLLAPSLQTSNIFSRVTGGNVSDIFGTIDTATHFSQANFWLINPAGVMFGATAELNVGGSFAASTADYLKMDGAKFYADPAQPTTLSMAPVSAFGFLGPAAPAEILVQGSDLRVAAFQTLSLVGGDLTIQGDDEPAQTAPNPTFTLVAASGRINLVSVGSPTIGSNGEVMFNAAGQQASAIPTGFDSMGSLSIQNANFNLIGNGGGTVVIRGGKLVMNSVTIESRTPDFVTAATRGGFTINATDAFLTRSVLETTTRGVTQGGDITITANSLTLLQGTQIKANTEVGLSGQAPGAAGNIVFNVGELRAGVREDSSNASIVEIDTSSNGFPFGSGPDQQSGNAGSVTIRGVDSVGMVSTPARLVQLINTQVTTFSDTAGKGGDLMVYAETFTMQSSGALTGIFAGAAGTGNAGNITIAGNNLSFDGTTISSSTGSPTKNTNPQDPNFLNQQARGGTITITGGAITFNGGGEDVVAITNGVGDAGNIVVNVGTLTMTDSANLSTRSMNSPFGASPSTAGNAGTITIQGLGGPGSPAQSVNLDRSNIDTSILGGRSVTTGGLPANAPASISLTAQSVLVTGGSIEATTAGAAAGGSILANVGNLTLSNGALLSSESTSTESNAGNSGNIALTSASDIMMRNSTVTTFADQASGGDITLKAPHIIRLVHSRLESSVKGQDGSSDGGNIIIDPQFVILQNSQILARAIVGNGGNIDITTGLFLADPFSLDPKNLSASSEFGISGNVIINSPIQVLSGALVPLNLVYSQAGLSGDRCAADPQGQFSSFVQTGRDGVPQVPGALSPSPLLFLDPLTSGSWGSPVPNAAVARLGLGSVSLDNSNVFRFHSACRS